MRVGLMTEFPSQSVQSGPAIHTRFLYETLKRRNHEVVMMGPDTTTEAPLYAEENLLFRGFAYPTHPKVKIPLPGNLGTMYRPPKVDVIHSQTNTHMVHYAYWMRNMWQIPVLNTHTVHLPTHSHFILSDKLFANETVRKYVRRIGENAERNFAKMYNQGDCLIVQSKHFVDYWRERGVTVPIEVVGRPIDPNKFSGDPGADPYPSHFVKGKRLVVVCRHDREKSLDQLIRIFEKHIAPKDPEISLTLVGGGFEHQNLKDQAANTICADRIHFPGEQGHGTLNGWYRHGDIFVYTSVSETFGNVVNEALWCGLPVVALDDGMGVAHQVVDGLNGVLLDPARKDVEDVFGAHCVELCQQDILRTVMSRRAAARCYQISHPDAVVGRFEEIYARAIEHCRETVPKPLAQRGQAQQLLSLTSRLSQWSVYNMVFLGLSQLTTLFASPRTEGAAMNSADPSNIVNLPQKDSPKRRFRIGA